jgi:hypothetical protein
MGIVTGESQSMQVVRIWNKNPNQQETELFTILKQFRTAGARMSPRDIDWRDPFLRRVWTEYFLENFDVGFYFGGIGHLDPNSQQLWRDFLRDAQDDKAMLQTAIYLVGYGDKVRALSVRDPRSPIIVGESYPAQGETGGILMSLPFFSIKPRIL